MANNQARTSVVDLAADSNTFLSYGPLRLYGVYVNETLSAHPLQILDGVTAKFTIPASASAGASYDFNGARFNSSLVIAPNSAATGKITVMWGDGVRDTSPSLSLDFLSGSLDSRITFSRASTATYFDSSGVLSTASSGAARFDYDPVTLLPRGLLIEEARTNSLRNNTMQGAVAGTPGTMPTNWTVDLSAVSGISREVVGTGTENGITYLDLRLSGTSAATATALILLDANNISAASPSQAWTASTYVKLQSGSLTGIASTFLEIYEYSSVPAYLRQTTAVTFTPTSSAIVSQRPNGAVTTGASTAFVRQSVTVRFTSGVAADITLRIGLPQLELGAFATSVIPTTTTALTRSADVASMTGTNFSSWYNSSEGTLFGEGSSASTSRVLMAIDSGAMSDRYQLTIAGSYTPNFAAISGGTVSADIYTSAQTAGSIIKSAAAYKVNDFALSANGSAVSTDTSGVLPIAPSTARLGVYQNGTSYLSGHLRRITYYPTRLSNATLQALTT